MISNKPSWISPTRNCVQSDSVSTMGFHLFSFPTQWSVQGHRPIGSVGIPRSQIWEMLQLVLTIPTLFVLSTGVWVGIMNMIIGSVGILNMIMGYVGILIGLLVFWNDEFEGWYYELSLLVFWKGVIGILIVLVGILIGSVGILIGSVGILIGSVGILIHWYFEHWYFERWYFEPLPFIDQKSKKLRCTIKVDLDWSAVLVNFCIVSPSFYLEETYFLHMGYIVSYTASRSK